MTLFDQWDPGRAVPDVPETEGSSSPVQERDNEQRRIPETVGSGVDLQAQLETEHLKEKNVHECTMCKPLVFTVNRIEVPVTDDCNRTCWACYAPVRVRGDVYIVDNERMICLCILHKDYEGRHGGMADANYSPKGAPNMVMEKLRTSQPRRTSSKPREPVLLKVVSKDDEVQEGQVIDEVAEFLKSMGRNV